MDSLRIRTLGKQAIVETDLDELGFEARKDSPILIVTTRQQKWTQFRTNVVLKDDLLGLIRK